MVLFVTTMREFLFHVESVLVVNARLKIRYWGKQFDIIGITWFRVKLCELLRYCGLLDLQFENWLKCSHEVLDKDRTVNPMQLNDKYFAYVSLNAMKMFFIPWMITFLTCSFIKSLWITAIQFCRSINISSIISFSALVANINFLAFRYIRILFLLRIYNKDWSKLH